MSCINWNVPDRANVDQDNNATESLLGSIVENYSLSRDKHRIYRESCGPSALEACLEGLGESQAQCGALQPSDYYLMWLNDRSRRKWPLSLTLPINRYPVPYLRLISELYPRLKAKLIETELKESIKVQLLAPNTVLLVNLTDPGHFVSGLHIDQFDFVHYNDSWLGNYWGKAQTHKRSMPLVQFASNVDYIIVVSK